MILLLLPALIGAAVALLLPFIQMLRRAIGH